MGSEWDSVTGFCDHWDEHADYINAWNFFTGYVIINFSNY